MDVRLPTPPPGYRDDELPEYEVHHPGAIRQLLRRLQADASTLTLTPDHQRWSVVTTLLDLDDERLTLDHAHDAEIDRQLFDCATFTVSATLDGVPIVFLDHDARPAEHAGHRALDIPVPDCLFRLQRRACFRMPLPATRPLTCRVPAQRTPNRPGFDATVVDIGLEGLAFLCDPELAGLQPGERLRGCRLDLPDFPLANVTLEVRTVDTASAPPGREHPGHARLRVGCRFVDLPRAYQLAVQRHVTALEQAMLHL